MASAYMITKGGYEGYSVGDKIYLSKAKAEQDLLDAQNDPDSPYYNNEYAEFKWSVEEFDLDKTPDEPIYRYRVNHGKANSGIPLY